MSRMECEQCKRLGHRIEQCLSKKNINTVEKNSDTPSLYEKPIFVNGHKINGLIDSGSGCIILRTSIAKKYNMAIMETPISVLRGLAGQITMSNLSTRCVIKIMDVAARVNAIVVPDSHLFHDILVGRDFHEQEHIVTIKRGNKLLFKQLPMIIDEDDNAIDINFLNTRNDTRNDTLTIQMDAINEEAKQQDNALLQEF